MPFISVQHQQAHDRRKRRIVFAMRMFVTTSAGVLVYLFVGDRPTPANRAGKSIALDGGAILVEQNGVRVNFGKVPTTGPAAASFFLLLRQQQISGPQPYSSPSVNADAWDFGDNAATQPSWVEWR